MNYVFDIDGTLTPSRLPIDKDFEKFFLDWMTNKDVYFVTGSDKDKTIEQIGDKVWLKSTKSYQSCGNAIYQNGTLITQKDFELTTPLKNLLDEFLIWSEWEERYPQNIEQRIGLINFSTIGRECPQEAREKYGEWDKQTQERNTFCQIIQEKFPELEATVGGQISIDIYPKGQNKSQVLDDIIGPVTFFGDKCQPGGNDYPLVERLNKLNEENNLSTTIYEVKNYEETWDILKRK